MDISRAQPNFELIMSCNFNGLFKTSSENALTSFFFKTLELCFVVRYKYFITNLKVDTGKLVKMKCRSSKFVITFHKTNGFSDLGRFRCMQRFYYLTDFSTYVNVSILTNVSILPNV